MAKKLLTRVVAGLIILSMTMAMAACGEETPAPQQNQGQTVEQPSEPTTPDVNAPASYTYNDFLAASPLNWNPHSWETNADSYFFNWIDTPLMDISIADDGVNYEWVYEGALAVTDITAEFADKEYWGIGEDEEEGIVYQIDLNPDLIWNDGTPVNADSYVYSMQQLLDPEMKNYRANNYITGDTSVRGGYGYFFNDQVGEPMYGDAIDTEDEDATYYFNLSRTCYFFGSDSMMDYYEAGYDDYFYDEDDNDLYAKYEDMGEYIEVTDEVIEDLLVIASNFGDNNPEAWIEFCFVVTGVIEETSWEHVGLIKTDEYQILYINEYPVSMFYFLISLTSGWLVHEGTYEGGKMTRENLVATDYGTSLETTVSCGPYTMVSFEMDKQIVLEKNETWYGWTDGKHEGEYQTTRIKIDIVGEHNTALQLFNQGKLDNVDLVSDDMPIYRMSDYLRKTDQTYTFRWIFATSLESLIALEEEANDGANKQILHNQDFRNALSLSIDRAKLATEATAAWKPAYYLFNSLYYYDVENNPESIYRNSTDAKEAVLRLYDMSYGPGTPYADVDEAYNAVTGYNVEAARELFQSAYEQAIADGTYTEGQPIHFNAMVSAASALTADDTRQQDLMNDFVTEATKGTGLEGKITFNFMSGAQDRYADVAMGRVEMIRGAWGGAAFYPFSTIRVYTEPDYMGGYDKIHESNGWNPAEVKLDITFDFDGDGTAETVTDTFQNWAKAINPGGKYYNEMDICLAILSNLETGVLASYQCIPWAAQTVVDMYSMKVVWGTLDYNIMYGYGGIRLLTYKYTDAEWDAFVASQGGTLRYE